MQGVGPAGQCLKPCDLAGIGGNLRLKPWSDLTVFESRGRLRPQFGPKVQLLLVVVQSTRGQLPYTQNEYKKTWEKIFLQIYVHADRLAHKLHDEEGTGHDVKTFI